MKSNQEILDILANSNCSEAYHKFSKFPSFPVATDGAIALAEAAGCFWLLEVVGSYQTNKKLDPAFQVWKLKVNLESKTAVVRGYNDAELIISQDILYTDFPLEEVKLYLIDGVILLPSEY
jgi:hypothetical protein